MPRHRITHPIDVHIFNRCQFVDTGVRVSFLVLFTECFCKTSSSLCPGCPHLPALARYSLQPLLVFPPLLSMPIAVGSPHPILSRNGRTVPPGSGKGNLPAPCPQRHCASAFLRNRNFLRTAEVGDVLTRQAAFIEVPCTLKGASNQSGLRFPGRKRRMSACVGRGFCERIRGWRKPHGCAAERTTGGKKAWCRVLHQDKQAYGQCERMLIIFRVYLRKIQFRIYSTLSPSVRT